jgi:hypothetical protein
MDVPLILYVIAAVFSGMLVLVVRRWGWRAHWAIVLVTASIGATYGALDGGGPESSALAVALLLSVPVLLAGVLIAATYPRLGGMTAWLLATGACGISVPMVFMVGCMLSDLLDLRYRCFF